MTNASAALERIAIQALDYVPDGAVVGLGTGRAASLFIRALGERVRAGLRVRGLATSEASADLARQGGIPLTTLAEVETLDVDVDGADEVDPQGDLIKGYGGALLREKVVASVSRRVVILVGPEKCVPVLGTRGKLPVEVVTFALAACRRRLHALGIESEPRQQAGQLLSTDNGNTILDCVVAPLVDPHAFEQTLRDIPGVVGTGLFLGFAPTVLIGHDDRIETQRGKIPSPSNPSD